MGTHITSGWADEMLCHRPEQVGVPHVVVVQIALHRNRTGKRKPGEGVIGVTVVELRQGLATGTRRDPLTAYVLGGGGNLGAIQVGMLRALAERGVVPDALFGCSVGAINAAALAADPSVEGVLRLSDIWSGLNGEVICPSGRLSGLLLLTRRYRSLQSNDGLRRLLEANIPYRRFADAAVPVSVVATSLRSGRDRWFSDGEIIPAVLASAALPALFPPVQIDGESYVDGGVVDNVPISRALAGGFERVYVLHVGNFNRPRPEPKRPLDALLQSFSIARNYRFQTETSTPPPGVELVVLPSIDPGPVKANDFGKSRTLIERAWRATASFLGTDGNTVAIG